MTASVNPATCIGCGLCASTCPAVFALQGDVSTVIANPVPPEAEDACRQACDGCPTSAITLSSREPSP